MATSRSIEQGKIATMNIQPFFLMLALVAGQYVFGRYPSFALILARPIGMVALVIFAVGLLLLLAGALTLLWRKTTVHPGRTPQHWSLAACTATRAIRFT